jgi:hypothetical protein
MDCRRRKGKEIGEKKGKGIRKKDTKRYWSEGRERDVYKDGG